VQPGSHLQLISEKSGPDLQFSGSCTVTCNDVQSDVMSLIRDARSSHAHQKNSLFWGLKPVWQKKTAHFHDLILTPAEPRPKMHGIPKTVPEQALGPMDVFSGLACSPPSTLNTLLTITTAMAVKSYACPRSFICEPQQLAREKKVRLFTF
jgi:hypothetical protein